MKIADDDHRVDDNGDRDAPRAWHPGTVIADTSSQASADAILQVALVHHNAGRVREASALYQQILADWPCHADALHFAGLLACDIGDIAVGIEQMKQSIQLHPNAIYYNNFGNTLAHQGRHTEAIALYRNALALKPDYIEAHNNLGNALCEAGDCKAAIDSCADALALAPDYAEAWNNLGNAFRGDGNDAAALRSYSKALSLRPDYAEAHNNLGNVYEKQNQFVEATACYRQAIALKPAVAAMHNNLGCVLRDQCHLDAAEDSFRRALALDPDLHAARSNLLMQLNFTQQIPHEMQVDEARRFGERVAARARPFGHSAPLLVEREKRLKVGFVSGDLKAHPVGFFLESVVAHLDAAQIELIAYVTGRDEDAVTARLKPHFSAWHALVDLNDETCARRIHSDGIDILVDLAGHTTRNRLSIFAWKPAPIQVSWLGYFATTGLRAIDYVLGDRHVLPECEASHFVERPWRLPDSYLCFTPPQPEVEVGPLPLTTNGVVTFGSFNHLVKINDDVVALWARVLDAVPGARLLMKARQLGDPSVQRATFARFAAHGIDLARLILEGESTHADYLSIYNSVDIALSPFPYPGGTTTAEALWMGVPVLCRHGDRFLPHIAESILHTVGMSAWIAADDDDYVAKAVAFSARHDDLMSLKATLRPRLLASPLCDATRFARNLEAAFRDMWCQHVAGAQAHLRAEAEAQKIAHPERNLHENVPTHVGRISL